MSLIPFFLGNQSGLIDPFSAILGPFSSAYPASGDQQASPQANFRVDWKETPEAHVFKAELPGLPKGDVKVEVEEEQKVLQIAGEWDKEEEKKDERWHRVERCRGKFLRRFRLPDNAKLSEVKANMDNGVLTVVVPKAVPKQPETKQIEISGGEGEPKPEA